MNPPFIRTCRLHGEEIEAKYSSSGRESLWCQGGGYHRRHKCRSWDVRDGTGEIIALAFMNESPEIYDQELAKSSLTMFLVPPPPRLPCKNDHLDWELKGETYRCGTCRRERAAKRHAAERTQQDVKKRERVLKRGRNHKIVAPFGAGDPHNRRYSLRSQEELNKKLRKEQRCLKTQ